MGQDLNNYSCTARLTKNHDLRYSNSGMAICTFSIAVNKKKRQQDGTYQEVPMYFDCTYFGKAAEVVANYLMKGQQVAISGSLEEDTWQDKNTGQKRSKVKIVVSSVTLIGSSNQGQQNQGYRQPQQARQQNARQYGQNQVQPQQRQPQPINQPVAPESFEGDDFDNIPF